VPFDGTNDFDVMVAQVGTEPPRPRSHNPEITPELDCIVLKALAKKPEDRFPDASEFRKALAMLKLPIKATRQPAVRVDAMPESTVPAFLVQGGNGGIPTTAIVLGFLCLAVGLAVLFSLR
jgi:serine/threonine-protein kinase